VASFTPRPLCCRGMYPLYLSIRWLCGPQIRSGCCGQERNLLPLSETELRFLLGRPSCGQHPTSRFSTLVLCAGVSVLNSGPGGQLFRYYLHSSCQSRQDRLRGLVVSFWLQIQRSRVRFPALPDFRRSKGSETVSIQPREDNWGATWMKK
jgi:hypothetical protein